MTYQQAFSRSQALSQIPPKKLVSRINDILSSCDSCKDKVVSGEVNVSGLCPKCSIIVIAFNRYFESNIPVEQWKHSSEKIIENVYLKKPYEDIVKNVDEFYKAGSCVCLAGPHGTFKTTFLSAVLKKAAQKNYSCLYTTLSDIISVFLNAYGEDKFTARRELLMVDFLVIDEFDSRFVTDSSSDMFGRILESVFRTRQQNSLPILMATNSPAIIESFNGPLKASIGSLFDGYVKMITVLGQDARKTINKG